MDEILSRPDDKGNGPESQPEHPPCRDPSSQDALPAQTTRQCWSCGHWLSLYRFPYSGDTCDICREDLNK